MIEHLFDEALLVALREGRREMNFEDVMEAKFTEEIGAEAAVRLHRHRSRGRRDARGGARDRRLPPRERTVASRCSRSSSAGARSGCSRTATRRSASRGPGPRSRPGSRSPSAGWSPRSMCLGESGTGPARRPRRTRRPWRRSMVGSFGMAGSLISLRRRHRRADRRREPRRQGARRHGGQAAGGGHPRRPEASACARCLAENRDVHAALRDALIDRDELVRDEILEVIEKALANRA